MCRLQKQQDVLRVSRAAQGVESRHALLNGHAQPDYRSLAASQRTASHSTDSLPKTNGHAQSQMPPYLAQPPQVSTAPHRLGLFG